ncbi:SIP domain-containing protein [Gryllotalpicola reticulitermitis]|uniref:SIP domain-containing protein n=1 Tax=Gryllotalpicola reticulitermitis TaxID=1184153 RepID=A0ABV8QCR7_9MICO
MSARRRGPSEHVLIAGDEHDLTAIEHVLWLLPDDAYGHVFVETLTDEPRGALPAPEGVTVTWLPRCRRPSVIPELVFADRGEPLAVALTGWASEWLTGGDDQLGRRHLLWIGAEESRYVSIVCDLLLRPLCNHVYPLDDLVGASASESHAPRAPQA